MLHAERRGEGQGEVDASEVRKRHLRPFSFCLAVASSEQALVALALLEFALGSTLLTGTTVFALMVIYEPLSANRFLEEVLLHPRAERNEPDYKSLRRSNPTLPTLASVLSMGHCFHALNPSRGWPRRDNYLLDRLVDVALLVQLQRDTPSQEYRHTGSSVK